MHRHRPRSESPDRATRRVSPTEVGLGYYERSVRILAELAEADQLAADLQTTPRRVLKVSAPVTFGIEHVATTIAKYPCACRPLRAPAPDGCPGPLNRPAPFVPSARSATTCSPAASHDRGANAIWTVPRALARGIVLR